MAPNSAQSHNIMADQSDPVFKPVYVIPETLNRCLLLLAASACAALLYAASHAPNLWITALCAIAFSFTANTIFRFYMKPYTGFFLHGKISTPGQVALPPHGFQPG